MTSDASAPTLLPWCIVCTEEQWAKIPKLEWAHGDKACEASQAYISEHHLNVADSPRSYYLRLIAKHPGTPVYNKIYIVNRRYYRSDILPFLDCLLS